MGGLVASASDPIVLTLEPKPASTKTEENGLFSEKEMYLWFNKHIPLITSIQKGSSMADLKKLFTMPGGIGNELAKKVTYVYKACPQIRIDVEFDREAHDWNDDQRTVISVSKPYLSGL